MEINYFFLFLDEACDLLAGWEKSCLQLEQADDKEAAESLYRTAHNLKSGSAAVGLGEFRNFVHMIEELIAKLIAGTLPRSPELIRLLLDTQTILIEWIAKLREDQKFVPLAAQTKAENEIKALTGEQVSNQTPSEPQAEPAPIATADTAPLKEPETASPAENTAAAKVPKTAAAPARSNETLRVAANKLDMLIQLAGELSTQQAIVWHARQNATLQSKICDNAIQLIQKGAKDLQSLALSLRMQPLQALFQRLERASRDLARTQNKKIEVLIHGDDVEIDRAVIERIADALMHVIRNAVDHGIEIPAVREEKGKPATAVLRFEASQEPNGVAIVVSDDGKGLDTERILKKAIEKGLAKSDQAYTTAEIQKFIFAHGFSTAETLTNVSGRGVGMDVVKNAVEDIGGSINLVSAFGKGTKFTISLPTTLSIIDTLIVDVDGCPYAVPVQDVAEIIDLSAFKLEHAATRGRLLSLRDIIVPVEHLRDHLPQTAGHKSTSTSPQEDSLQTALLIKTVGGFLAFQVRAIIGQQRISMRELPSLLAEVPGYTGGAILGDGEPCIILNLPVLVRRHLESIDASDKQSLGSELEVDHKALGDNQLLENRHLIFRLGERTLGTPIVGIREIISDAVCQRIVGTPTYVNGCIDLRGQILPVLNMAALLQLPSSENTGPLVIVDRKERAWAFSVDEVKAVSELSSETSTSDNNPPDSNSAIGRYQEKLISLIDLQNVFAGVDQLALAALCNKVDKTLAQEEAS